MNNVVVIIPARLDSYRFPRKLLQNKTGISLIQHTYEQALKAAIGPIYIATDSSEIALEANKFGCNVIMTGKCDSGTARIASAVSNSALGDDDIVINVQGDEPEFDPELLKPMLQYCGDNDVVTLSSQILTAGDANNPNIVKVVSNLQSRAMYFSRSCIPWYDHTKVDFSQCYRHIGIYAYKVKFLKSLVNRTHELFRPSKYEYLEQLDWLDMGATIKVINVQSDHCGIDTPEDYNAFCERYSRPTKQQRQQPRAEDN